MLLTMTVGLRRTIAMYLSSRSPARAKAVLEIIAQSMPSSWPKLTKSIQNSLLKESQILRNDSKL